jgi:hypothetical protein
MSIYKTPDYSNPEEMIELLTCFLYDYDLNEPCDDEGVIETNIDKWKKTALESLKRHMPKKDTNK